MLDDGMACDIIKIGNLLRNKERFAKRRLRLIGPQGNTLKAIELLTKCYVLVQGNTVAAIGDYKGLKEVRRIVLDCLKNVHPVYHIKELMIKRELAKDDKLKNESWDRFLPHFKKSNVRPTAKPATKKDKKEYTPFPPAPTPRKVDLALESGEYFLKPSDKKAKEEQAKQEERQKKVELKEKERQSSFIPPKERPYESEEKRQERKEAKEKIKKDKKEKKAKEDKKEESS